MNHTNLIFVAFSFIVGILVFAIWSNTHVFAQQLPSLSSSLPPSGGSGSSSPSSPISSELKAKMCDPSNPSLKVVNTTESNICGIAKTVKPPIASAATPPQTSAVSSPSSQQTATTIKPSAANITAPKQQQTKTTNNNNINAISRPIGDATGTTIATVSHPTANGSSSPSPAIAPQTRAVNEQKHALTVPSPITLINSTARQNDTFAATPPVVYSDKMMYLGYHGDDGSPTNRDSSPNDKSSSESKLFIHRSSTTTSNHGNKQSSLLPDLESAIKNKVDSIIKNTVSRIKDNTPLILPFP
jgi:hypothetical protein